ncbi:18727_t:CDS:2, partial [Rhizophagus irregularis]
MSSRRRPGRESSPKNLSSNFKLFHLSFKLNNNCTEYHICSSIRVAKHAEELSLNPQFEVVGEESGLHKLGNVNFARGKLSSLPPDVP